MFLAEASLFSLGSAGITGGLSGGPLFTVVDSHDTSNWHLGGVIALGSSALDILRACPADRLQPDGTLRR